MDPELNSGGGRATPDMPQPGTILLNSSEVGAMRQRLHELANVFTGVMIAGGLLSHHLEEGILRRYAAGLCQESERGCNLVCELRSQLLLAGGEPEATSGGNRRGTAEEAQDKATKRRKHPQPNKSRARKRDSGKRDL